MTLYNLFERTNIARYVSMFLFFSIQVFSISGLKGLFQFYVQNVMSIKVFTESSKSGTSFASFPPLQNQLMTGHGCSDHLNLKMEAECLMKNLSYLDLNISRTKNGINK